MSHLVDIRASQINGCAFCLDMHVKEARLHHVAIWRESSLFKAHEKAGVSDEVYAEVLEQC